MEGIRLILLCAVLILPYTLVRKHSAEQAIVLSLAVVSFAVYRCAVLAVPLLESLEELFFRAGIESAYIFILLRTVAAALVTQLCAGLCRDGGSQAIAAAVELIGAISSLLIAMPLIEAVVSLLADCFS